MTTRARGVAVIESSHKYGVVGVSMTKESRSQKEVDTGSKKSGIVGTSMVAVASHKSGIVGASMAIESRLQKGIDKGSHKSGIVGTSRVAGKA